MGQYYGEIDVGATYETRSRTVTESDIGTFTNLMGIHEPMFKDREYYEETRFGTLITPGPMTFSLSAAAVLSEGFLEETVVAFLGLDSLDLAAPVRRDDTITSLVEVVDKQTTSSPDEGIVRLAVEVVNQERETVMKYEATFLVERRPGAQG